MTCSNCGTEIPPNERFCRNCGQETIPLDATTGAGAPTLRGVPFETPTHRDAAAETARIWAAPSTGPISTPTSAPRPPGRSPLFIPAIVGSLFLLLAALGGLAYFLLSDRAAGTTSEATGPLPDHFGIFLRKGETLTELRRVDFSDAIKGRDAMLGDATLPRAEARPVIILYAESQDIPTSDLKLVQLDGIDPSGSVRYWNFQAAPIEGGRRGMKQIKEGNHKFWPFQVTEGAATPTGSPQMAMLPVKNSPNPGPTPKPSSTTPTPRPTDSPTTPSTNGILAYCNDDNVVLRGTPSLDGRKVNKLMRGQKVWVIGKSPNKTSWGGVTSDWSHVQLYDRSQTGWVFSPFISY
jgi:hypothetical protein